MHALFEAREEALRCSAILLAVGLALAASGASATVSSWPYGRWDVTLAPAENILVLSQDGRNITVEARSVEGSDIRVSASAAECRDDRLRLSPAFTIPRAVWERRESTFRAAGLRAVFEGWTEQANLLCPDRVHRLDFRKLDAALRQFDLQLGWGKP